MPYNHPKLNLLEGGWYVVFNNGEVFTEPEGQWSVVPNKKDIKIMGLKRHNKYFELEGKESYLPPGESHLKELTLGAGNMRTVDSLIGWFIGYYGDKGKIYLRVDSKTGKSIEEVVPY